ncbi:MAG: hypothetical protein FI707_16230 [SAR202 cluster bacterium]|jgi:hypothetical protein|nr:hypothetical protein [SAR202 cluster bacterium]MDP6664847.1 hypothetical protein [SAR202 cluster bacterium]MDP6801273.1 hypothetical protein [SAR202 cluster bacterium]MQG56776.1 hypothetical protein [SAR202 cluster bacterium]MQG70324.1 hypothetical protein [SAR202 cluster bacterium]|tara:strand:- start:1250 stop:1720 length:471 start_codon:yes stop_codon:yes gene_type:complete
MDFNAAAAIVAGLGGGAVMSAFLYMGIGMMPKQMKMNLFLLLGTMMVQDKRMAYVAGAMMHGVMSIAFGLAHVALYTAFGLESALVIWGVLFGLAHWLISGMGLSMMPTMHPAIRRGELQAPGAFAMSLPTMTATGFFMLHVMFGILVGAFYTALA